ncbi:hypothetical protein L6261_02065 [Candidatus Parcubacteria bacterium]|nr:hypothetical protein [Candidatus Parcubacteria bacterium]
MNFLEQLATEWYEYKGYFVRTNLRFGKNAKGRGGNVGEMDVIAYEPDTKKFVHIESSTDANSWEKRKKIFEKKFSDARQYYMEVFPFKRINIKPKQIAIVGFNLNHSPESNSWKSTAPDGSLWGDIEIEVIHIPKFLQMINEELKNKDPQKDAIPESYPLLRAIQYSTFYKK